MVSREERSNYRMLFHSVSPHIRSGYGNLMRHIPGRLKRYGYDIFISCYYGIEPGGVLLVNDTPCLPSKEGRFGEVSCIHYFRTLKANLGVLVSDPWAFDWFCYDKDTEVLTDKGFKYLKDLEYEDKIATLSQEGYLEYQYPIDIQEFDYNGKMFKITNSNQIDLMVTPEHRLYVKVPNDKPEFKLIQAKEVFKKTRAQFKKNAKWKGKEKDYFVIPKYSKYRFNKDNIQIEAKLWLEFLGYYLSEGDNNTHRVGITQTSSNEKISRINKCLTKLPFKIDKTKDGFVIYNTQVATYLKEFGDNAITKFVPEEVKKLTPELIKIFLSAYIIGDGTNRQNGSNLLYTSSKRMADDLQELVLKAGYASNTGVDERIGRTTRINDRTVTQRHKLYCVSMIKKQLMPLLFKKRGNNANISRKEWVDYSDKVYCCSVPNEVIFVRRNGKTCWSGNSAKLPCTMAYAPLDHTQYPEEIQNIMRGYTYRVAPSHFQQKEWASYDPPIDFSPVIYHGVETKTYFPMDKKESKKSIGIPEDCFVFGQIAANSDKENRKGFAQIIRALRIFLDSNPDVKKETLRYLIFSNPADPRGLQLELFLKKQDIRDIAILQNPLLFSTGIKDSEMNVLYNAMDVQLYASFREGFGMPILEAMSCGIPNIVTNFSSMPELVEGRGWVTEPMTREHPTPINALTSIPDSYNIAKAIEDAYFDDKLRKKYNTECRKFALQYDWDDIVREQWVPLIDSIIEESKPKAIEDRKIV